MRNSIQILVNLISQLMLLACAGPSLEFSGVDKSESAPSRVVWEPSPRPVAKGNDGQLLIRTSESINILYAAHDENGRQNLFMSKTKNIGDSFSGSKRVNPEGEIINAHGENGPKLRSGSGRGIFAAWVAKRDIKFSRSMNFGRSFGPPLRVNDDKGKASQSFLSMDVAPNGSIFLAWLDGRDKGSAKHGTSAIYIARSMDQGKTFEKNIKVAGDVCPCCRPAVAFGNNGEIFVSWRHVYNGNERIIVVATSTDGGITWNEPVKTTNTGWKINGCAHSGPTMKYLNGKLFITWYTGKDNKARLRLAYSGDQGKSFQVSRDLNGPVLDANHPDMTLIGNEAWVVFQGRDPLLEGGWGPDRAWLVRVNGAGEISEPSALPSTGGSVAYPYLYKGNGGRVYATWTEVGEKGPKVILCRGRVKQ